MSVWKLPWALKILFMFYLTWRAENIFNSFCIFSACSTNWPCRPSRFVRRRMYEWKDGWKKERWIYFHRQSNAFDHRFSNPWLRRKQPLREQNEWLLYCFTSLASSSFDCLIEDVVHLSSLWFGTQPWLCPMSRRPKCAACCFYPRPSGSWYLPPYISAIVMRTTPPKSQLPLYSEMKNKPQGKDLSELDFPPAAESPQLTCPMKQNLPRHHS